MSLKDTYDIQTFNRVFLCVILFNKHGFWMNDYLDIDIIDHFVYKTWKFGI